MSRLKKSPLTLILSVFIAFLTYFQPLGLVAVADAETVEMEYSDSDHIHAPKVVNGVTYEYDANGNLVSDGERTIEWNQDNLPTKITKDNTEVKFSYGANGVRVAKEVKDKTTGNLISKTIYVNQYYEQSTPEPDAGGVGSGQAIKYYFANGRRIATNNQQQGARYLHQDHLGSTVLTTNDQSQPTSESLAYLPYGNSVSMSQSVNVSTNYLFTGQELDSESALYNYNARLYNPTTGSFISADSVGGGNRYSYAKNNPLLFTDPTGLRLPEETPEESHLRLQELQPSANPEPAPTPLDQLLVLATAIRNQVGTGGLTTANWEGIEPHLEEFGPGAVWAIEDSILQSGELQCVGFVRAYTMLVDPEKPLPRLGGGPEEGKMVALSGLESHGPTEFQEGTFSAEPGDILWYQRKTESGFSNHWAVVAEVTPTGATLVEAVGSPFRWGGKIEAVAGGVLVGERVFDFESGSVTGTPSEKIIAWGIYRLN